MTAGAARVLYFDAGSGASGDMLLGALVAAGAPLARIRGAIAGLGLERVRIRARSVIVSGIAARKIDVGAPDDAHGRTFREIAAILDGGGLVPEVRDVATRVFRRLFEAEAEVHGAAVESVHLHEAGAIDAIVDVVGAVAGISELGPSRIACSPLTTGWGTVRCAHGLYPVPSPATLLLTRGVPTVPGSAEGERLTPTGAAILTTVVDAWGPPPPMRPVAVGYGAGDREFPDRPNLLRAIVGEEVGAGPPEPEVAVVECALDDVDPQRLAFAAERLFAAGALDVEIASVSMKKGRAGRRVTVLTRPDDVAAIGRVLLRETGSLGLRWRLERRLEAERGFVEVATGAGPVRVKVASLDGRPYHAWPEYEDCAAAARRAGVPLEDVRREALRLYETARGRRRAPRGRS